MKDSWASLRGVLHLERIHCKFWDYCFCCLTRLQLQAKYSIFEETSICRRECCHDKERKQEGCTSKHHTNCTGLLSGWWFEPLWKIWKSIGMMTFPIYGKIKNGNQTTNQKLYRTIIFFFSKKKSQPPHGEFFLKKKPCALAQRQPPAYKWQHLTFRWRGCCILAMKTEIKKSHILKALFAGNVAQVQTW